MNQPTIKMPKNVLALVLAAALLLSFAPPVRAESPEEEPDFDGYLVALSAPPTHTSPLEAVTDGVYWVEDTEQLIGSVDAAQIEYIEPNYIISLWDTELFSAADDFPYAAVRADYPAQYGLTGRGVRIAVIDSGVDPNNVNLQQAKFAGGYDYLRNTATLSDDVSHGTNVIQLIAGSGANGGVQGIAPEAEIIPLRCFSLSGGNGSGSIRVLVKAIRDAVDRYNCDVINMSWGFASLSDTLHEALQYAASCGVILVAAAGNVSTSYPQGTLIYPAAFDEVIGVGSVDAQQTVLSSSQQTAAVYLSAPGKIDTFINSQGKTVSSAGTSFAAPCVSAAAAILRQAVPLLDQNDIAQLFRQRSLDAGAEGWDPCYGYGLLRLDALLAEPWANMRVSSGTARIYGWQLHAGGSTCVAAAYRTDGRMAGLSVISSQDSVCSFTHELSLNGGSCKVFYLDSAFNILSPCDVFGAA